ncbi:MAG TPA: hypothetical protein PK671_08440 [Candidatus Obscuribacter sp.]|nr:hypothetical protein [Candidatus Obscuribacter sp.]HMY52966.1 hypothetical protein [Candidatus Obscuribacter sp.]HNA72902.1 hypothetical protein [Candidatus Obscuribacter sp.]HND06076.1 hypothetical protein [Candidatus Obscuribacter sp.]HNH75473.1 hypothetical protein [Candidatus Obscuribacter sp.]
MHPLDFPLISYFVDWKNVTGTYILGALGVLACLITCVICWYQIFNGAAD